MGAGDPGEQRGNTVVEREQSSRNDEKARAVVTRYGWQGGERFGGYELRHGKGRADGFGIERSRRTRCMAGNVADPMAGCRAQQTYRRSRGVSRRSREERQGRNVSGPWQVPTEGEVSAELGVDARQYAGGGADLWTTP